MQNAVTRIPVRKRLETAFNILRGVHEPENRPGHNDGPGYSRPRNRHYISTANQKNMVASIFTRCATDVASIKLRHVKVDENEYYLSDMQSGLQRCLTLDANLDQTSRALITDAVISMLDEGHVVIVPTDTDVSVTGSDTFDVLSLRTGRVVEWKSQKVRVRLYSELSGDFEEIWLPKSKVAIIENPFYLVMNEPNSTLRRLVRKINLMDEIDEQVSSGKLDLIIQLPYAAKSDTRKQQAEDRRQEIEEQLRENRFGIAYIDGTEKVIQLNRAVVDNLLEQVNDLTKKLYAQMSMTESIIDGTANEETMINYWVRTVEPIVGHIALEMTRKFISLTGYTQGQRVRGFRDIFALTSAKDFAELADKLSRNEIATGNEFRAVLGWKPSSDPSANELRNKNIALPSVKPTEENSLDIQEGETSA